MIIALVDDLFFSSKISSTAGQMACPVKIVTDGASMLAEAASNPEKLIFDLNCRSCDPVSLIREIRRRGVTAPMLGFVSHVQGDLIKAAQQAGCDQVVARSYFSAHLPEILAAS